jgi:hypothetical protein
MTEKKPKCMTPSCPRQLMSRGLCSNCLSRARKLVSEKAVSWEEMEKAGMVAVSKRVAVDFFTEHFQSVFKKSKVKR